MFAKRVLPNAALFLSLLALLGSFVSCEGGGGSGAVPAPTRVALFLTDGPTDDFSHVYVTVTSATLMGDKGGVTLFSAERTLDLLSLTQEAALITLVEGLPEGSYNKLRLEVSGVVIIRRDGTSVGSVKLPSGKIDLNPQGPFRVVAGEPLLIVLDFDAEKSIHVVGNGKNGEVIFRPVVFVKVADAVSFDRLVRVSGTPSELDAGTGGFVLTGDDPSSPLQIITGAKTSFFSPLGLPSSFTGLAEGGFVTVAGFPLTGGNDTEPLGIEAVVAEMGTGWATFGGTVMAAPAPSGVFPFLPDDAANGTSTQVILQAGTKVYGAFGQELSFADLLPGSRVRVDAVVSGGGAAGYTLHAALVILRTPVQGAVGSITALDETALAFSLKPAGGATVQVQATPGTIILLLQQTPDGLSLDEVSFSLLAVGQMAAVSGYASDPGGLRAACVAAWWASELTGP